MAKRKRHGRSLPAGRLLLSAGAVLLALFVLILLNQAMGGPLPLPGVDTLERGLSGALDSVYSAAGIAAPRAPVEGGVTVHYIDVGQADCELIQTAEQTILIDAGDTGSGDAIIDYLKAQGVSRIDLLVATHPHADHIGGMAEVVEAFEIGRVLFSSVPDKLLPTTRTYENLLDAIASKRLKITRAKPGTQYDLGGGAVMAILGPAAQYEADLNESSVVCRVDFGETSFLFTGDASKNSEDDLLQKSKSRLSVDVLKLGHHGSDTSTQEKWLDTVAPSIAVACVGRDNTYGHPSPKVLRRLEDRGITLYRTDRDGTVVIASDGKALSVSTEK